MDIIGKQSDSVDGGQWTLKEKNVKASHLQESAGQSDQPLVEDVQGQAVLYF